MHMPVLNRRDVVEDDGNEAVEGEGGALQVAEGGRHRNNLYKQNDWVVLNLSLFAYIHDVIIC